MWILLFHFTLGRQQRYAFTCSHQFICMNIRWTTIFFNITPTHIGLIIYPHSIHAVTWLVITSIKLCSFIINPNQTWPVVNEYPHIKSIYTCYITSISALFYTKLLMLTKTNLAISIVNMIGRFVQYTVNLWTNNLYFWLFLMVD